MSNLTVPAHITAAAVPVLDLWLEEAIDRGDEAAIGMLVAELDRRGYTADEADAVSAAPPHRYDPAKCSLALNAGEGFHCLTHCATVPAAAIEKAHR